MKFTIGFEKEDTEKLYKYWGKIIDSQQWSEGKFTKLFEERWSDYNQRQSVAFSSWGGAVLAALEFFKVSGRTVLCPSNTFMATPLSIVKAGANVEFVDCNRDDLCVSLDDLKRKIDIFKPIALWVVHIGGHIAFQINEISSLCKEKGVILSKIALTPTALHGIAKRQAPGGTQGCIPFMPRRQYPPAKAGCWLPTTWTWSSSPRNTEIMESSLTRCRD